MLVRSRGSRSRHGAVCRNETDLGYGRVSVSAASRDIVQNTCRTEEVHENIYRS